MQTIYDELRLDSGLLTLSENVGIKIESNSGIRANVINANTLGGAAICFGYYGTASGNYSAHFGYGGTASGYNSTHFGTDGTASGSCSTHFGNSGEASGSYSAHFGIGGTASGSCSTHFGTDGTASGICSTHFGNSGEASGSCSTHFGNSGEASGSYSAHFGIGGTASGYNSTHFGTDGTASGNYSAHFGYYGEASGSFSAHFGLRGVFSRYGQTGFAAGMFASNGDAQFSIVLMRGSTTDATQTTLTAPAYFGIDDEKAYGITIDVLARSDNGSEHAFYKRQVLIQRTGGTTALVGSVQTIGTDIESSAGLDVAITADNTTDRLEIKVTGLASTNIRWLATLHINEVGYAV